MLAPAVSVLQLLKSGTLSLRLFECVPAMLPFAINSRPTTSSWPSNPLSAYSLAPQIRLWLTIVRVYTLYLLTYLILLYCLFCADFVENKDMCENTAKIIPVWYLRYGPWSYARVMVWHPNWLNSRSVPGMSTSVFHQRSSLLQHYQTLHNS